VAYIFVANEDVDVFPHLALFGCHAISNAGVERPQRRQSIGQGRSRSFNLDAALPAGELAQGTWKVKRNPHGQLFPRLLLARDLLLLLARFVLGLLLLFVPLVPELLL